jgi:WD40 repeat protein
MAVSPDGTTLTSINRTRGISVWDMASGKLVRQSPQDPARPPTWLPGGDWRAAAALSADGSTAAFAGPDGTIYVIDVATGKERQRCLGARGEIRNLALSGNGRVLATRSADETLRAWDVASGKETLRLPTKTQRWVQYYPVELALSADGKTLVWVEGDAGRPVHVYDLSGGRQRHRLLRHEGQERTIAISPDGRTLFAAGGRGPAQLWDLQTGRLARTLPHKANTFPPAAAFAPDGRTLVMSTGEDAMRMLEVATGRELWHIARRYSCNIQDIFAFSPDGKTLVVRVGGIDHVLHRYNAATGERQFVPGEKDGGFEAVAFAADGRTLYTLGGRDSLGTWDAAGGEEIGHKPLGSSSGRFSPDGSLLATNGADGIRVYQTVTGQELARPGLPKGFIVSALAFSPDGGILALSGSVGNDARLIVWSVPTRRELRVIATPAGWMLRLEFTSDGQLLVGRTHVDPNTNGRAVHIWNVAAGWHCTTPPLPPTPLGSIPFVEALSPDGKTLAAPSPDHTAIEFYELATGQVRLRAPPVTVLPCPLRFSPDGSVLLAGDNDGAVRFFDPRSGRLLLRLEGHRGPVDAFAFSPDGRRLATLSQDGTALVWDMEEVLHRVGRPRAAALSPGELRRAWADLADGDAAQAYQAIGRMAGAPEQALPWLREHLRPVRPAELRQLQRLLAELDKDDFATRERATAELAKMGEAAKPELRRKLAANPTAEFRRRAEQLLQEMDGLSPKRLRAGRAVEVLEQAGGPGGEALLAALAEGAPEARLTQEAKAALLRLRKRSAAAR